MGACDEDHRQARQQDSLVETRTAKKRKTSHARAERRVNDPIIQAKELRSVRLGELTMKESTSRPRPASRGRAFTLTTWAIPASATSAP